MPCYLSRRGKVGRSPRTGVANCSNRTRLIIVMREAIPSLELNGVNLFYAEKGAGEPVVFVHGIPTDYRAWDSQLDSFSEHYRAIAYGRRYAYPNAREGDLLDSTVENNAIDLMGLLEKLRATPAHIVGHSYGGFISLYVAAHHPEMVRSFVLVEPAVSTLLVKNPKNILEFLLLFLRSPSVALSAAKYVRKGNNPAFKALDKGDLLTAVKLNLDAIEDKDGVLDRLSAKTRAMMIDNARTVGELRTRVPVFHPRRCEQNANSIPSDKWREQCASSPRNRADTRGIDPRLRKG